MPKKKNVKKEIKPKKKKVRRIGLVIKEADSWFSKFIRLRDNNICYTCNKQLDMSSSQCGHFIPRDSLLYKYDESNSRCQCYVCNIRKKGNYIPYTLNMIKKYGIAKITKMWSNYLKDKKQMSREDYEKIITTYKDKYEQLIKKQL